MGTGGTDLAVGAAAATVEKWNREDAGEAATRRGEKAEEEKRGECEAGEGRMEQERIGAMRLEAEAERNKRERHRI
jgi:hypothetical protein